MKTLIIILSFFLISCDSNPLGESSLSSCGHAPDTSVGLPLTCQVNIPFTTNLFTWLDANDSGTVVLQNQSQVIGWIDKSGNGINLGSPSGALASQKKGSTNSRNSILFSLNAGAYTANGLSGFPANQAFTIALSFKTGASSTNTFQITNNDGFRYEISNSNEIIYAIGGALPTPTGITLTQNTLYKNIIIYNPLEQTFNIYNDSKLIFSQSAPPTTNAWTEIQIIGAGSFEIDEILIYRDLVDVSALQIYLNNKWGF